MSCGKLIYFGLQARAESTRMCLGHAKAVYDDERLTFEEFGPKKAAGEYPNGQLPVWVQDGTKYHESLAILRLVGRQFGYYPPEHHDMWQCDSVVDYANDFLAALVKIVFFDKNMGADGQQEYCDKLRTMIAYLTKRLSHGKDFMVGDKITIADFHVASVIFAHVYNDAYIGGKDFTDKGKQVMGEFKEFSAYIDRVKLQLSDYLASRPSAPI